MRLLISILAAYSFSAHTLTFVEDPDKCLKESVRPCAVKNLSSKPYRLQVAHAEFSLGSQGILWVDEDSVRVVRGECLIMVKKPQKLETAYMKTEIQSGIVLMRVFDTVEVDMIEGVGQMWIKGDPTAQEMTAGFHWSVGGINRRGIASIEVPQSSVFKTVVKAWAQLNFLNKSEFFERVDQYREKLISAVEASGQLNQNLAKKMVEDDAVAKRNAARIKAQIEAENKSLRQLFRKKNDMD